MSLDDPMQEFLDAAQAKDKRGIMEHRGGDSSIPFKGKLSHEYEQEQLDSFNYLTRMFDEGTLAQDEYRLAAEKHMECWRWMRYNVGVR